MEFFANGKFLNSSAPDFEPRIFGHSIRRRWVFTGTGESQTRLQKSSILMIMETCGFVLVTLVQWMSRALYTSLTEPKTLSFGVVRTSPVLKLSRPMMVFLFATDEFVDSDRRLFEGFLQDKHPLCTR